MIIVDKALEARAAEGRPVRIALTGAGLIARGMTNRVINYTPGMELSVIVNRTLAHAIRCLAEGCTLTRDITRDSHFPA